MTRTEGARSAARWRTTPSAACLAAAYATAGAVAAYEEGRVGQGEDHRSPAVGERPDGGPCPEQIADHVHVEDVPGHLGQRGAGKVAHPDPTVVHPGVADEQVQPSEAGQRDVHHPVVRVGVAYVTDHPPHPVPAADLIAVLIAVLGNAAVEHRDPVAVGRQIGHDGAADPGGTTSHHGYRFPFPPTPIAARRHTAVSFHSRCHRPIPGVRAPPPACPARHTGGGCHRPVSGQPRRLADTTSSRGDATPQLSLVCALAG